ncbi:hypothetical protein BCR44DRAFT_40139 [Catenaria anguillulae PL171]|uniref:Uncharacterized protein n=1 Tax=Catenaria anguillulae PL171 TaxID=765915 RepID=A0A1Y2HP97_9FUNG|nr:hypothetical protein BCR44DRAFT_40139 [Catenaria anguillulae PL171]
MSATSVVFWWLAVQHVAPACQRAAKYAPLSIDLVLHQVASVAVSRSITGTRTSFSFQEVLKSIAQPLNNNDFAAAILSNAMGVTALCDDSDKLSQLAQAIHAVYLSCAVSQCSNNRSKTLPYCSSVSMRFFKSGWVFSLTVDEVKYPDELMVNFTLVLRQKVSPSAP